MVIHNNKASTWPTASLLKLENFVKASNNIIEDLPFRGLGLISKFVSGKRTRIEMKQLILKHNKISFTLQPWFKRSLKAFRQKPKQ